MDDFSPPEHERRILVSRSCQFLFREGANYVLMDLDNYDQFELSREHIGEQADFLTEGQDGIKAVFFEDRLTSLELPVRQKRVELHLISVELPRTVELELISVESKQIGDTTQIIGTLETGAQIELPYEKKVGTKITVDPRLRRYVPTEWKGGH